MPDQKTLQRFLGCINYATAHYLLHMGVLKAPLQEKMKKKNSKNGWNWNPEDTNAVAAIKRACRQLPKMEALDTVHASKEDQESVFAMLAAVLRLGNVSFTVIDNENHVEAVADEGENLPEVNMKNLLLLVIWYGTVQKLFEERDRARGERISLRLFLHHRCHITRFLTSSRRPVRRRRSIFPSLLRFVCICTKLPQSNLSLKECSMVYSRGCDFSFCNYCGKMLNMESKFVTCPLCKFKRNTKEVASIEISYTVTAEAPTP
ncbi:hypothetical protein LWI29_033298 [Acer saccharum]|uniref:Uncharacterized protein n=1 Tax=Acer saccharum TaxID=4024 RepID=A0AA39VZ18_ACESA|nr:hypothetical protein LWI29_033298 [Acer saccharum]